MADIVWANLNSPIPLALLDQHMVQKDGLAASNGAALVGFVQPFSGAVPQTVQSALQAIVPASSFGIFPDGTDQTVNLQKFIDSGYKRLFLDYGTYNFTSLLFRGNSIEFFGVGSATILNCISTTVFAALCLVESYVGIHLHDFQLQGAISSEPAGPNPLRGIVNGTNTTGTAHSALSWTAFNIIERIHFTGSIPGSNGFNLGCQFNAANYSTFQNCLVDSLYGTSSSYGYGIVCNGTGQNILNNRFLSTINGQGRHAVYMTNTPFDILCQGNYALNFQNEAYTSNTGGSTSGTFGYLKVLDNVSENCLQVGTGGSPQQANIDINAPYSIVSRNTIKGSNFSGISVFNVEGVVVSDNIIIGVKEHGLWVSTCSNLKVHHNQIFNPDSAGSGNYGGVEIVSCTGSEFDNNRIYGTSYRFGLRFNGSSPVPTNCQIFDNNITGSFSADIENPYIDPSNAIRRVINEPRNIDYTPGATTVDVSQNIYRIGSITNTGPVTITNLTGAHVGQIVTMVFYDTNTTVARGIFVLAGGVDFVSTNRSALTVSWNGGTWDEISRAVLLS